MKLYEENLINLQEVGIFSKVAGAAKEGAKKEAKDFFSHGKLKGNIAISAAFAFGLPVAIAIFKAVRARLSSAHRKCGTQGTGPGYTVCVSKEKLIIFNQALQQLNSARSKCGNNAKCQNKINTMINGLRDKILIAQRELEEAHFAISAAKKENLSYKKVNEGIASTIATKATSAAGGFGGLATQIVLFSILDKMLAPVFKEVKEVFSEAERRCASIDDGPAKEICKARIKMMALQKQEAQLNKVVGMCNAKAGTGNPKCLKYIEKLNVVKEQIKVFRDNIEVYQQALRNSFTKPE